jgi:predicted nucleotidyltransferase component of viral defense system
MAHKIKNVAASVRARLLEISRSSGRDFQLILTNYTLERLLYRLSVSKHRKRFVLKGALLFTVWLDDPFRPTRDLDLMGTGKAEANTVANIFREILSQETVDDGLVFDVKGLHAISIRDAARYGGVRVETEARLERARVPVRIDIGYGDAVTPAPTEIDYPTLLKSPAPHLRAYPRETVVAEKLEAITSLGLTNSRMKDFYDLCMLARHFDFDGPTLADAIDATFKRRGTPLPAELPDGLTEAFIGRREVQTRWRAFRTRDRLSADIVDFGQCVSEIRTFVEPVLDGLRDVQKVAATWPAGGPWRSADGKRTRVRSGALTPMT